MKDHLSGDQVLEWVMGLRDAGCEAHLRGCGECAEAVETVAGPLRLFGAAARELGSERLERVEMSPRATRFWWPVAVLAAALLIFAVLPRRPKPVAVSDDVLLQNVEYELSESVPGPMEPLATLMTVEIGRSR